MANNDEMLVERLIIERLELKFNLALSKIETRYVRSKQVFRKQQVDAYPSDFTIYFKWGYGLFAHHKAPGE